MTVDLEGLQLATRFGFSSFVGVKEAIRGFSKTVAKEWGRYRINVNIICPLAWSPASEAFAEIYPDVVEPFLADALKNFPFTSRGSE